MVDFEFLVIFGMTNTTTPMTSPDDAEGAGATSFGMAIGHVVVEKNAIVVPSWCGVDGNIVMRTVARNNKKTVKKAVLEPSTSFFHDNTVASYILTRQCSQ